MKIKRIKLLVLFAFWILTVLYLTGCGLLGGDDSEVAVKSTAPLSSSPAALALITRSLSDDFSSLKVQDQLYSSRLQLASGAGALKEKKASGKMITEKTAVGTTKVSYGPADAVDVLGVAYTFTAGSQIFQTLDSTGAPVDDKAKVDSLVIINQSLAFRFSDEGSAVSAVSNGKLKLAGFQSNSTYSVTLEDFSIAGTINGVDSFSWKRNGSVIIDAASYPFPKKNQSESSTLAFNGVEYKKLTVYDGTASASSYINGPENLSVSMNLTSGKIKNSTSGIIAPVADRFSVSDDGVITDKVTRLQWFRSTEMSYTWIEAFNWTKALSNGGGGWWMPSYERLHELYSTAGSADFFPTETWTADFTGPTRRCVGTWSPNGYDKPRGETVATGVLAVRPIEVSNPMRIQAKYYTQQSFAPLRSGDPGWSEYVLSNDDTYSYGFNTLFRIYRIIPGGNNGEFKPLGDLMFPHWGDRRIQYRFAKTAEAPDALANPIGFEWQGDNAHKRGKYGRIPDLHYFRMIPPPGYVALGYCYRKDPGSPNKEDYWCVKAEYVVAVTYRELFNDSGSGWSYHDMNLYEGVLLPNQTAGPGRELRIPSVSKGYCTGSGHPNPGPLIFYALDLPQGMWPQPER